MRNIKNRSPGYFAFRAFIGGDMLSWDFIKQTAFNINVGLNEVPLIYQVFTDPEAILMQMTPW